MRILKSSFIILSLWSLQGLALDTSDYMGGPLLNMRSKRINITVTGVSIQNVIRAFAKQTGINVVIAEGVEGNVSVILKDADPIDALTSILGTKGYSWYAQDELTLVATPNRVSHTFHLQYAKVKETFEALTQIAGQEGVLSPHLPSNTLVVNGTSSLVLKIQKMLEKIDQRPQQVVVETKIIQLKVGNVSNLGLIAKYTHVKGSIGTQGFNKPNDPGLVTTFINNSLNLEAALSALETREDFNLVASPKIFATENTEAQIHVGKRLAYRLSTSTQTAVTESVEFLDVGTRLIFTPRISSDGIITLTIHPEVSDGDILNGLPNTTTAETTTEVSVPDGQTVVIGGLIEENSKESTSGVPFLKDIPILGIAFRNRNEDVIKSELLVFMTPHIVNDSLEQSMQDTFEIKEEEIEDTKRQRHHIFL